MSNLIVVRSEVEVQALKQTGSVNAEDMGHTGEIKEGIGEEVRVVGAVESGIGRQRQASSCAVSSCILGRRTASATVAALDSPGSQRFAASFATPEEESCMQWDALWPKRVQELQYSAAHGVGQGVGSAAKHFSQTSVR